MKTTIRTIQIALVCLTSVHCLTVYAGPGRSGGGNAIVCFNDPAIPREIRNPKSDRYGEILKTEIESNIISIEALDLNIAKAKRINGQDNKIIEVLPNENPFEYIERIAKRYDNYVPELSAMIRERVKSFPEHQIMLRQDHGITRVFDEEDIGYLSDKQKCVVATMANQYISGNNQFLEIDARLYLHPSHKDMSKAVLLLHEIIYSYFRKMGDENSLNTRNLIRLILSKEVTVGRVVDFFTNFYESKNLNKDWYTVNPFSSPNSFGGINRLIFNAGIQSIEKAEMLLDNSDTLNPIINKYNEFITEFSALMRKTKSRDDIESHLRNYRLKPHNGQFSFSDFTRANYELVNLERSIYVLDGTEKIASEKLINQAKDFMKVAQSDLINKMTVLIKSSMLQSLEDEIKPKIINLNLFNNPHLALQTVNAFADTISNKIKYRFLRYNTNEIARYSHNKDLIYNDFFGRDKNLFNLNLIYNKDFFKISVP